MNTITKAEAENKSDKELISLLKEQWNISENKSIEVVGRLRVSVNTSTNYHHYRIYGAESIEMGAILNYPFSNLDDSDDIPTNGIYVPPGFDEKIKKYLDQNLNDEVLVRCELALSDFSERERHENPFLLRAEPESVQVIKTIRDDAIVKNSEGVLIEESIVKYYKEKNKKVISDYAETERIKLENENIEREERYNKISLEIIDENEKKLSTLKELDENIIENSKFNQNIISAINEKKIKAGLLDGEIRLLNGSKDKLEKELAFVKEAQMKRKDKFNKFLKNKADSLRRLEFIDEEQYNEIIEKKPSDNNEETGSFIDFDKDLESNFSKAIEHIQAYLFNKDIIYPQYLLEDYFSLIQTNDLIILAGDSGSGKTNLVKSFAEAVSGVAKIIPVKPSWTSSEDLLGYYNPLQKAYLSTPFLEALIEASNNPETPYFICLDEMNLARVEYYFADFLSVLEERDSDPEIFLYSDDESNHVLSEFNNVIRAIEGLQNKHNASDSSTFYDILNSPSINSELKEILGLSDKVSLISYHSTLRRMLGGILSTPPTITFPSNVRIIGAINIDETTHYLSPKVLDRAHVIKFDNPLLANWKAIEEEVTQSKVDYADLKLKIDIDNFGTRKPYPKFSHNDIFCRDVVSLTKEYLQPLGVEIGLRTIRQGLNYKAIFEAFNDNDEIAFNNFILHKILPKFTFDGNIKVADQEKSEIVDDFKRAINEIIAGGVDDDEGRNTVNELTEILDKSKNNDGIVNYWA